MSKSQYETSETYEPYPPYGPDPSVHTAETLAYGLYPDTYRPAYEAQAYFVTEPVLPRQGGSGLPQPGDPEHDRRAQDAGGMPGDVGTPDGEGACVAEAAAVGGGRAARRRRVRCAERPESAVRRLLPQALVVAFLAGGTTAFVAKDKAIELSVDGKPRTLHTFADDVHELLAEEGVHVGAHDAVAPAPGAEIASGDTVAVRYGRPVRLTL
ncbi:ubiquitin-like domain-containing protein, partial [Streptomyces puniciscabiei]